MWPYLLFWSLPLCQSTGRGTVVRQTRQVRAVCTPISFIHRTVVSNVLLQHALSSKKVLDPVGFLTRFEGQPSDGHSVPPSVAAVLMNFPES